MPAEKQKKIKSNFTEGREIQSGTNPMKFGAPGSGSLCFKIKDNFLTHIPNCFLMDVGMLQYCKIYFTKEGFYVCCIKPVQCKK